MMRSIMQRFKKNPKKPCKKTTQHNYVMLCPKCYFATSSEISVAEYIEMHDSFNAKFVDKCANNFTLMNSKRFSNYEDCSPLFYSVC
ncbi:hypothetical protein [Palpita vitrealis nucleopolyhedrovirus]|uniref:Ac56 n=1 Tax=Palpita vitrealis nucleopolyhedrovirus TaxID=2951960 RepID=A0AAE9RYQ7_9ABAC|nr:hypothetical protein [Palpita vitrealis nucleopolyhedrovirus]